MTCGDVCLSTVVQGSWFQGRGKRCACKKGKTDPSTGEESRFNKRKKKRKKKPLKKYTARRTAEEEEREKKEERRKKGGRTGGGTKNTTHRNVAGSKLVWESAVHHHLAQLASRQGMGQCEGASVHRGYGI